MDASCRRADLDPSTGGILSGVHQLFEGQVDRAPESSAIVSADSTLSYREVERRANQIARYLRSRGVKTGDLVGLFVDRSPDAIVAILSILKAGAAYLPLDPAHPAERIRHIVREASVAMLISETHQRAAALDIPGCEVLEIDDPRKPWHAQSSARMSSEETSLSSADLCYVLYTSGSTGRPKGVMTEHGNVLSFIAAFNEVLQLTAADRVFQGFSLGFDGSVEEMWMAFSNGATLVVPPRGTARFGNELAHLITSGNTTVFSTVPTSLAMISDPLPTVAVLIVSGERCSREVVKRWATSERRMLNVYGPTETTVNATVAECRPDRAVTIGRPLRGYDLRILDESRRPVGPREKGELFIVGPGVARGYLNQPTLTEESFVELPGGPANEMLKAYRTGDLVSLDESDELLFHGRIDDQVKVRGYRIELSEIEAVLSEADSIRSAAVTVVERDGGSELAAYVLADDVACGINRNAVLRLLGDRLPTYMIPAFLDVVETLPTLSSGKVDRKRLPPPLAPLVRTDRVIRGPSNAMEKDLLRTFRRVLRNDSISTDDDFFMTLGGYSLLAAQLVSDLRRELGLEVAIRDIYDYPTIVGLAARLKWKEPEPAPRDPPNPNPNPPRLATGHESVTVSSAATRIACALSQALALYLVYAVTAVPYLGTLFPIMAWRAGSLSLLGCVGAWLLVWGGTWPTLLGLSVAAKWILIGRYRPGRYPLWGWYYFRWWLVRRFQMITGSAFLTGTPLMPLYLRAMGARVGRRCTIDTPNFAIFDLLTIGDDTSIGSETQLLGYRVEDGCLLVGSIDIGSRCFIGMHSALGLDVRMGDEARLDDQSLLADATSIAPHESKRGSPARPAAVSVPDPGVEHVERQARPLLFGFLHVAVLYSLGFLMIPTAIPAWTLLHLVQRAQSSLWLIASIPVIGTVTLVALCLWIALLNQLILPRVRPGVYPVESIFYLRKWAVDTLMQLSRALARPLYTTIYLPSWLRLLGAKIGRRAEISTVSQISPKLTHIGDQSFFADGAMIGGRRVHRGLVQLAESRIGRRSFVGNGAILPVGTSLGDNSLLGVLSAPPARHQRTPDGSEWLGSPSFALPHRRKLEGFDHTVTHEPTRKLIAQRLLIDGLRIVIPSTLVTGALVGLTELVEYGYDALPFFAWVLALPMAAMVFAAAALVCVVAIKKILIGTFVPTVKPLWSMFVWLNEALNGAYETVGAPILALLLGTPYCAPWLRLLGCKIGHNVFLETTLFSEFDLVHIGDNVALNAGAVIQNHLFEDRIMKVSVVTVGDDCSVGNMAVVLYDTEMQAGSSIGPLSLLMKGETLPPQTKWAGIPTAQAARWGEQTSRFEPLLPVVSGVSPLERSL